MPRGWGRARVEAWLQFESWSSERVKGIALQLVTHRERGGGEIERGGKEGGGRSLGGPTVPPAASRSVSHFFESAPGAATTPQACIRACVSVTGVVVGRRVANGGRGRLRGLAFRAEPPSAALVVAPHAGRPHYFDGEPARQTHTVGIAVTSRG